MTIGVQLNLTHAFNPNFGLTQRSQALPRWLVLGDADYLELRGIETFSQFFQTPSHLGPQEQQRNSANSENEPSRLGCEKHINLIHFPFDHHNGSADATKKLVESDDCLMFWIQVTVSPVCLEVPKNFEHVRVRLYALYSYLQSRFGEPNGLTILWSLGSFDFALLKTTNTEEDLVTLHNIVNELRHVKHSDVFKSEEINTHSETELPLTPELSEYGSSIKIPKIPVFSTVTANIACNLNNSNCAPAKSSKIIIRSRFKATQSIEKLCDADKIVFLGVEQKWIHKEFESLSNFMEWIKKHYWDIDGKRLDGLGSSFTEVLIPVRPRKADSENIIAGNLNDESELLGNRLVASRSFVDFQRRIDLGIKAFAAKHIGPTQGNELEKVLTTYYQSLARNDRLMAMRDLAPFFLQLASVLENADWVKYLEFKDYAREHTSVDLSILTNHLWRAIRNRIESHCEHTDPLLPASSEHVAVKLLNAYTVVAWLCSELLRRKEVAQQDCSAGSFGVCVCTGSAGRVEGKEIFQDFRRSCEQIQQSTQLGDISPKRASLPLLLLNISGPILFRPEAAFAHCLHEMAEFSNWLSIEDNGIKKGFSWHAYRFIETLFFSLISATPEVGIIPDQSALDIKCLLRLAALDQNSLSGLSGWDEVNKLLQEQLATKDPLEISSITLKGWLELASETRWVELKKLPFIDNRFDRARSTISATIRQPDRQGPGFGIREFNRRIGEYRVLLREIAADYGMIRTLWKLKSEYRQHNTEPNDLSEDINYAFHCLLEGALAWLPRESRTPKIVHTIVARWAALHRMTSIDVPLETWETGFTSQLLKSIGLLIPGPSLRDSCNEAIENHKELCLFEDIVATDSFKCISRILSEDWKSITQGNIEGGIVEDGGYIRKLLATFVKTWDLSVIAYHEGISSQKAEQSRLEMVFDFWAKSQKFGVTELFDLT